jgi:hypothetical protein
MTPFACPRCGATFEKWIAYEFHAMTTRGERCEELAPGVVRISQCSEFGCLKGENHDGPHQSLKQLLSEVLG